MKKFIFKSTIFFIVAVISFVAFWSIICSNRDETMRLPENCYTVFVGNSHIECAINDTILKNCFNFGRSADKTEFIYSKVKLLKKYNPELDTIVIGYDNVLCYQSADSAFNSVLYSPYFFDTHNLSTITNLLTKSSFGYIESHITHPFDWFKLYQFGESTIKSKTNITDMSNLGGYLYLIRDKLKEDIKRRSIIKMDKNRSFDELSIYFLDETLKFCQDNNMTVIFLCPPQHKRCFFDSTYYREYYTKNYSNIKFYDFKDMELPDSCFGDLDHLNYKGAKVFSEYLEKEILHKNNYKKQS